MFLILTFVDFMVLGLFGEFWINVHIDSFSIGLLAAAILQLLLRVSVLLESKIVLVTNRFNARIKVISKVVLTWCLLFFSKLLMLEIIDFIFGDKIDFSGVLDGVIAFIVVVITMVISEVMIRRFYLLLRS
ncbi:hypothetical protein VCO01S_00390 [Vibrio comitans NBRC 102076]|uniref:Uncharacterized protein n=2 Tax=Vibrio comitans TaxID=413401 RepID=A0A4Y3IHN1_9VIBR|nr:hypothetical protein VCO01S_00390 [Vibrio comitans NBRC 102076]